MTDEAQPDNIIRFPDSGRKISGINTDFDPNNSPNNITPISESLVNNGVDQRIVPDGSTISDLKIQEIFDDSDTFTTFVVDRNGGEVFRVTSDNDGDITAKIITDQNVDGLIVGVKEFFSEEEWAKKPISIEKIGSSAISLRQSRKGIYVNLSPQSNGYVSVDLVIPHRKLMGPFNFQAVYDFFAQININNSNLPEEIVKDTFDNTLKEMNVRMTASGT